MCHIFLTHWFMLMCQFLYTESRYDIIHNMKTRKIYLIIITLLILLTGCTGYPAGNGGRGPKNNAGSISENDKDTGLHDGEYEVPLTLEGGTGKASVGSPAKVIIEDGNIHAFIVWSSDHYDYMIVDGKKYLPEDGEDAVEGHSVFKIPIKSPDDEINIIADTTAMSTPHEIEYVLRFDWSKVPGLNSAEAEESRVKPKTSDTAGNDQSAGRTSYTKELAGIEVSVSHTGAHIPLNIVRDDERPIAFDNEVETEYAKMFTAVYSDDGYAYIHIEQAGDYLVIPEDGKDVKISGPIRDGADALVLCKPFENIYLVSSSTMDIFASLDDELKCLSFSGLDKKDWCVDAAVKALDAGTLTYAGKYSAPDYELLLAGGCDLAIENTMIYHKPEVIEKLNSLGIPVLVEVSSYEPHPLGRMEWIKLYGLLTGQPDRAQAVFEDKLKDVAPLITGTDPSGVTDGPSVAFFYITSTGAVNVRKSNDYISRMISMAGGKYIPDTAGEDDGNALSTVNMQMEAFYAGARDADILIYNGTIDESIGSIEELIGKDKMLADFKAVKVGRVYTTDDNLFQRTMSIPDLILDFDRIFNDTDVSDKDLIFLKQVR